LEYFQIIGRDGAEKEINGYMALILAIFGNQYDLSTTLVVLQNSPHLFSNDPDITKVIYPTG